MGTDFRLLWTRWEHSGSKKGEQFFDWLSDYQLMKKGFIPLSYCLFYLHGAEILARRGLSFSVKKFSIFFITLFTQTRCWVDHILSWLNPLIFSRDFHALIQFLDAFRSVLAKLHCILKTGKPKTPVSDYTQTSRDLVFRCIIVWNRYETTDKFTVLPGRKNTLLTALASVWRQSSSFEISGNTATGWLGLSLGPMTSHNCPLVRTTL